jgi:hypothetical protein
MINEGVMVRDKYYIKTRGVRMSSDDAAAVGIVRVYNYTSDIDFIGFDMLVSGIGGCDIERESVLVESAIKFVGGVPLYVSTCIVFRSVEMCNIFYIKNRAGYKASNGFHHLFN